MSVSVYTTPLLTPLLRLLARLLLRILGWRVESGPPQPPKCMVVGAPHTSNWDYVIFLCVMLVLRLDIKVMVKDELYRPPFRAIMRWAGVIPVNRRSPEALVEQLVQEFAARERLAVLITPEGTRRRVTRWKTGVHRIASAAGIPVVLGYMDYERKRGAFGPVVHPGPDMDADLEAWQAFYDDKVARHAEGHRV
jgi:1-acyl-sn-glycerol-3-phosphate acyltransferase